MDLEMIWQQFMQQFSQDESVKTIERKIYSGYSFLYICSTAAKDKIELKLSERAGLAMRGKQLRAEFIFVRVHQGKLVYRARFYVPLRKHFCCGNGCTDCIRFHP